MNIIQEGEESNKGRIRENRTGGSERWDRVWARRTGELALAAGTSNGADPTSDYDLEGLALGRYRPGISDPKHYGSNVSTDRTRLSFGWSDSQGSKAVSALLDRWNGLRK